MTDAPFLIVIAGPNGSGKTTLTNHLRQSGIDFGEYINPDEIAAGLTGNYDDRVRQAQSIADLRRDDCIVSRRNFSFETVMSHPSKIATMQRARSNGFRVVLYFIATCNPRINVARVGARVALGGHDVPDDKIIARYRRTIALLPAAMRAAHTTFIFDNSATRVDGLNALQPIARISSEGSAVKLEEVLPELPEWLQVMLAQLGL